MKAIVVKVNAKYQITIPRFARQKLKIKAGDRLLLDVQDGVMVLIPQPGRYTESVKRLHSEIRKDVDIQIAGTDR